MNLNNGTLYTEDMIKSEELFLNHINEYINTTKLKQFPKVKTSIGHFVTLSYGLNKGEKVPVELKDRLEKKVDSNLLNLNLNNIDYQTDVVIVGSGGAGLSAAIQAAECNAHVLVLTKDRGFCNTVLAQGGIQAVTEPDDSLEQHLEDTIKGGHYKGKKELIEKLVNEAPQALLWLKSLGVEFREEPIIPGGSNKKRLHTIGDNTGANIMKALLKRVEELSDKITVIKYADVQEILKDENGFAAGVVFKQLDMGYKIVHAKSVILATGGSGSLHYNNLNTSNCKGSTADGLAMAYHAGAKLVDPGAIQYHPTGGVYPADFSGKLISEKARSLGALLFNSKGEALQSVGNRDDIVRLILSEEASGNAVKTPDGNSGIWLAIPMIDKIHGEGTIEKRLPSLFKRYLSKQIDIRKHAILVYPTIHYHLGGIDIDTRGMSSIQNLFAVGEVSGGIDGDNRLMGNALASIIVYGRTAGKEAAEIAKNIDFSKTLSLDYLLEMN